MIKRIRKLLSAGRRRRSRETLFNSARLEHQREDVFALMHQQMNGLR